LCSRCSKGFRGSGFGEFADRVLELCNHFFSPMYARVFKKHWNNGVFSRVKRNYCATLWDEGIYEVYTPTRENIECNMQYYRIVVKVVPEADQDAISKELLELRRQVIKPAGVVDSELIAIIAPRRSREAGRRGEFFRGFRHARRPGYLTAIIVDGSPEECMRRLLKLIIKFLGARIEKLLERLNIKPWKLDYKEDRLYYIIKYAYVIETFSLSITNTIRCLSHTLSWLRKKLRQIEAEIRGQRLIYAVVRKAEELSTLISKARRIKRYSEEPLLELLHSDLRAVLLLYAKPARTPAQAGLEG